MAFRKTGDAQPVGGYFDINSLEKPIVCELCGKQKVLVAMKNDDNELICECELDKPNSLKTT